MKELTELHLAGTRISDKSLPHIIALPKLKYISVPRENAHGFGRSSALTILGNCATLRTLDCQEGYFFFGGITLDSGEQPTTDWLTHPICLPTLMFIVESLTKLAYICVCETEVTQDCVRMLKSRKPSLEICYNVNHTP